MKYSFFSSACRWFPSALMMAVSASGASSAPLASCVRYVPVDTRSDTSSYLHAIGLQLLQARKLLFMVRSSSDLFYLYV